MKLLYTKQFILSSKWIFLLLVHLSCTWFSGNIKCLMWVLICFAGVIGMVCLLCLPFSRHCLHLTTWDAFSCDCMHKIVSFSMQQWMQLQWMHSVWTEVEAGQLSYCRMPWSTHCAEMEISKWCAKEALDTNLIQLCYWTVQQLEPCIQDLFSQAKQG